MLKSKIHFATVEDSNINYEGSISIPAHIMDRVDILEFEQVHVYNVTNGARFITYAIRGDRFVVNGAAARLCSPGDKIIIASYAEYDEDEIRNFKPKIIYMGKDNEVIGVKD